MPHPLSQKSRQKGKTACKKDIYARVGVPYYVVFDPLRQLQDESEMDGALLRVWELNAGQYRELTTVEGIVGIGQCVWLDTVGLGLMLWKGAFEESIDRLWWRWCELGQNVQNKNANGPIV
ncbi:MAG TPA: hypothetical protein IGS31_08225 [Oscillatoriales cyanobacterium M4454_W2019_049]|nr:hypothetical protein [Oscillatoriales cyanobacterium M4454_W2019_049]